MDQELPCRQKPESRPRWEIIFCRSSHVRGSAGHSSRPSPVPGLHQRPALKSLFVSTTVCRRLSAVQSDQRPSRRRLVADRPSRERDWQMLFNSDNVKTSGSPTSARSYRPYTIHGQQLKEISQAKYLGVTIDSKLSWNSHVDLVTKRANQTTAFLRRNLSCCSRDVKAKCYKSLVRPQLDYAFTMWDPYTKTNATKVEAVQRRAARFFSMTTAKPAVSLQ